MKYVFLQDVCRERSTHANYLLINYCSVNLGRFTIRVCCFATINNSYKCEQAIETSSVSIL